MWRTITELPGSLYALNRKENALPKGGRLVTS